MHKKLRLRAFLWAALGLALGSAVAAPVCYNPLTQTIPGVTVTTSGSCNVSVPSTITPPIAGYNPPGFSLRGDNSSCSLSFSTPVKNRPQCEVRRAQNQSSLFQNQCETR